MCSATPAVAGALTLPAVVLAPFLAGWVVPIHRPPWDARADDQRAPAGPAAVLAIALLSGERVVLLLLFPLLAFGVARPVATIAGTAGAVGAISAQSRGLAAALATQSPANRRRPRRRRAGGGRGRHRAQHPRRAARTVDAGFDAADRKALDAVLAGGDNADSLWLS